MRIDIFTDGSCQPTNPNKGGYGAIIRYEDGYEEELTRAFRFTTNNRMELLAVINSLEKIIFDHEGLSFDYDIHVYSDSKYVVDAVNKNWLEKWSKKNWSNVKNPDLWKMFLNVYDELNPTMHWVKGHSGHIENERCDVMADKAALSGNYEIDTFYENN